MSGPDDYRDMDQGSESKGDRRVAGLSGVLLLLALAVLIWLIWTFAQRPASVGEQQTGSSQEVASVVVPDVVGVQEDVAVRRLQESGLSVEVRSSYDVVATPGTVASQEPVAGESVKPGAMIVIAVVDDSSEEAAAPDDDIDDETASSSEAKPSGKPAVVGTVVVPKLVGLSEKQAVRKARSAGLDPRVMKQPVVESIGRVFQQDPAPGKRVPEGRKVFVLVGSFD